MNSRRAKRKKGKGEDKTHKVMLGTTILYTSLLPYKGVYKTLLSLRYLRFAVANYVRNYAQNASQNAVVNYAKIMK